MNHPDVDWSEPVHDAVRRLARTAIVAEVDLVVIAGDIVDRDGFDAAAATVLRESLCALDEAGIRVMSIDGNHDAADGPHRRLLESTLSVARSARHLAGSHPETVVFDDLGLAVHGRGVPSARTMDDISAAFPRPVPGLTNIGMLHTSLDGTRPGKPCAPVAPDALAAHGYDYWALGHVHQCEVVRADPWIVYSGNPQGRGSHEHGPKGATIVETDVQGGVADVRHVEIAPIGWATVQVVADDGARADDIADHAAAAIAATLSSLPGDQRLATRVSVVNPPLSPRARRDTERAVRDAAALLCLLEGVTWAARDRGGSARSPGPATIEVSETAATELRRGTTKE